MKARHYAVINILSIAGLILSNTLSARDQQLIDSLMILIEQKPDTSKFSACVSFADGLYYQGNLSESVYFYEWASNLEQQKKTPDKTRLITVFSYVGNCLYDLGQYVKSIEWFEKALPLAKQAGDTLALADLFVNIGNSHFYLGHYQESVTRFQQALELDRAMDDSLNMAVCLNNLGKVFHAWKHYETAIDFYKQALDLGRLKNDSNGISIRLSSIAASYMEMNRFDQSIDFLQQAFCIDSSMHNTARMAGRLDQLGLVYQRKGEFLLAERYFQNALDLLDHLEKPRSRAIVLSNLGQNYLLSGRLEKAKNLFEQSLILSKELGLSQTVLNNYRLLSEVFEKNGDFRSSKRFLEAFMEMKDSVFNEQSLKTIEEFRVLYETGKKDNEISRLNQEKEIQSIQIRRTQQQRLFFFALAIALLIVAVLLFFLFENRKRTGKLLNAKNKELAVLNSTKDRFISILAHDLKNPFSAFVNITTAMNENFNELEKQEIKYYIGELNQSALHMNDQLLMMLEWANIQMKPVFSTLEQLEVGGLVDEVIKNLKHFAQTRNVELINQMNDPMMLMGNAGAVTTILNNLLTNAIKFSPEQGQVFIMARELDGKGIVSVKDQGTGISETDQMKLFRIDMDTRSIGKAEQKGTGLGLIVCGELIAKMGGTIGVESQPGQGSTFYFSLQTL